MKFLIVALGAGAGGVLRYYISTQLIKQIAVIFPLGTLTVNVLGSFLLGFLIFAFDEKELLNPTLKLLLGVGFCGGFTTFSTFSLETINLIRDTQFLYAGLNIFLNVILTMLGVYLGYIVAKV